MSDHTRLTRLTPVDIEEDIRATIQEGMSNRQRSVENVLPLPSYVRHSDNVSEIGRLSAQAVVAQYEATAKSIEAMGRELIEAAKRAEKMADGVKDAIAHCNEIAAAYREEGKRIFEEIERTSILTDQVKLACSDMRKKIEPK